MGQVVDPEAMTYGNQPEEVIPHLANGGRDFRVQGNDISDYIGVSPEYMTYANETDKPINTDYEALQFTKKYDHLIGNGDDEGNLIADDEDETDENGPAPETPAASSAPLLPVV